MCGKFCAMPRKTTTSYICEISNAGTDDDRLCMALEDFALSVNPVLPFDNETHLALPG